MINLKKWRTRHKFTQDKLGKILGVPRNTIARWERGEVEIRHKKILKLALCRIAQGQPQTPFDFF